MPAFSPSVLGQLGNRINPASIAQVMGRLGQASPPQQPPRIARFLGGASTGWPTAGGLPTAQPARPQIPSHANILPYYPGGQGGSAAPQQPGGGFGFNINNILGQLGGMGLGGLPGLGSLGGIFGQGGGSPANNAPPRPGLTGQWGPTNSSGMQEWQPGPGMWAGPAYGRRDPNWQAPQPPGGSPYELPGRNTNQMNSISGLFQQRPPTQGMSAFLR